MIFPAKDKFLQASRLFKLGRQVCTNYRSPASSIDSRDTSSLLNELSELQNPLSPSSNNVSTPGSSRCSTPFSDVGSKRSISEHSSMSKRKCTEESGPTPFKLPCFSPDIKLCISKDSFYTSSMRNKLIKEGCTALRGHCWGEDRGVTTYDKRSLAIRLYELAPKSLGDHCGESKPEVSTK